MSQLESLNLLFLANALNRVIEDHKRRGEHDIDLNALDYYHALPADQAINVYEEPAMPLPIGSTHDDISELQKLISDPDRLAIPHDLERLANLMRAVAAALDAARSSD